MLLLSVGGIAALVVLFGLLIRYGGTSVRNAQSQIVGYDAAYAFHAENSNRTKHLRDALARSEYRSPVLLVLGRPRTSIKEALAAIDPEHTIADPIALRPASIPALVRAIPTIAAQIRQGIEAMATVPCRPPFSVLTAMCFRMSLGQVCAQWWQSVAPMASLKHVLFAHTGTAEASGLELALQRSDVHTVHVMHGSNTGWPFAGLSNTAFAQSKADAEMARSLPAYGRVMTMQSVRPPLALPPSDEPQRWALLTSYSHLQHPAYRRGGSEADRLVIEWVAEAAAGRGVSPENVLWRPHPHIKSIDSAERDLLEQAASQAGFTRWPAELPYGSMALMDLVVTTPSTVMIDALRMGQPPIVLNVASLDEEGTYARYPLLVEDRRMLEQAIDMIADATRKDGVYTQCWDAVGPGGPLKLDRVEMLLRPSNRRTRD